VIKLLWVYKNLKQEEMNLSKEEIEMFAVFAWLSFTAFCFWVSTKN
jgi:hypothetical protein